MGEPKKKISDDQINSKIQHKFDLIFIKPEAFDGNKSTVFNQGAMDSFDNDFQLNGETPMSNQNSQKKPETDAPGLNLDFNFDTTGTNITFDKGETAPVSATPEKAPTKLTMVPDDGLEFSLDFSNEAVEIPSVPASANKDKSDSHFELDLSSDDNLDFSMDDNKAAAAAPAPTNELSGQEMAFSSDADSMFDDAIADAQNHMSSEVTQKTIVYNKGQLTDIGLDNNFKNDITGSINSSADLMSSEEAKANIDATIKDIIRPKSQDSTQELDISAMGESDFAEFEIETSNPRISNTDSLDFNVKNESLASSNSHTSVTGEFDLDSVDFGEKEEVVNVVAAKAEELPKELPRSAPKAAPREVAKSNYEESAPEVYSMPVETSFASEGESARVQATIRQLREERELLLGQMKTFKSLTRELEQDNLTLKAALDESKIEVSILRKRHMVELEDLKYRLSMNEEKKAMAIEAARQAESKREKLEQRVRIDFNQVKQREKELETKLEMLTIDVDSQVQSRDQKILELRRKIDALEFNMENVSIKEQKSEDDKRKLEDKLHKIMKTLRHSIKNLEEDIDQVNDEVQDARNSGDHRLGKA